MPSFATTNAATVAPKTRMNPNKGVRKAAFEAVMGQVATLADTDVNDPDRTALVLTLEPEEKALTVQNQIRRAAARLGIEVYARRKGQDIVVFKTGEATPEVTQKANNPAKRGPKGKKAKAAS